MNRKVALSLVALLFLSLSGKAGSEPEGRVMGGGLGLKVGDQLLYRTASARESQIAAPNFETARGPAFIPPLPTEQVVRVIGETKCDTGPCLILEVSRTLPSFLAGSKDETYREEVKAHIDKATGDVFDVQTTITIGSSVSRSTQQLLQRDSTLADFYGPWMLGLRDGYALSNPDSTGVAKNLEVTGRERILGRDCFVVKQTLVLPSRQRVESTMWVDVQRRVAIQIDRGGRQMKLVR